jgi:hypothetical protein
LLDAADERRPVGLGHVPHMETAAKTLPPLVGFLKEGVTSR